MVDKKKRGSSAGWLFLILLALLWFGSRVGGPDPESPAHRPSTEPARKGGGLCGEFSPAELRQILPACEGAYRTVSLALNEGSVRPSAKIWETHEACESLRKGGCITCGQGPDHNCRIATKGQPPTEPPKRKEARKRVEPPAEKQRAVKRRWTGTCAEYSESRRALEAVVLPMCESTFSIVADGGSLNDDGQAMHTHCQGLVDGGCLECGPAPGHSVGQRCRVVR